MWRKNKESEFWSNSLFLLIICKLSYLWPCQHLSSWPPTKQIISLMCVQLAQCLMNALWLSLRIKIKLPFKITKKCAKTPCQIDGTEDWPWKCMGMMVATIILNEMCIQTRCIFILRELSDLQKSLPHLTATSSTKGPCILSTFKVISIPLACVFFPDINKCIGHNGYHPTTTSASCCWRIRLL